MKEKNNFNMFSAILMALIISFMSVAGASANSFSVNDPLDPLWADGEEEVDYTFEITNDEGSLGKIRRVEITFPDLSWWLGTPDSCEVNSLPGGWMFGAENGMCIYYTSNEQNMIGNGETFNFIPVAFTDSETGTYEWDVWALYREGEQQPPSQATHSQIDNTNPELQDPELYDSYHYENGIHWVNSPFNLRSIVSDQHSGIDEDSCEIATDGIWEDADYNDPYCQKEDIEITHLESNEYQFRVEDNVGNDAESDTITLVGDTEAPITTDDAPCEGWEPEDIIITLTPNDPESGVAATYYCIDEEGTCTPDTIGTEVLVTCEEGQYCEKYVRYYSIDNVGNQEDVQQTDCLIQIDKEDPRFENIIFDPESPSNNATPELMFDVLDEASGIDLDTFSLVVTNGPVTLNYSSLDLDCTAITNGYECLVLGLDPLEEGVSQFDFYVEDFVGNSGTAYIEYELDTIPPITTDDEECSSWYIEDQVVILNATDSGSGVAATYYCVANDGNTCTDWVEGTEVDVTCPEGEICEKYVRYYSIDNVGNEETVKESCTLQIDKDLPYVWGLNVAYPNGQTQAKNGDEITIVVGAEDENGIDRVELDATNIGEPDIIIMDHFIWFFYTVRVNVSGTTGDEDQNITVTAYDNPGNSNSITGIVEIDNSPPIIDPITFTPESPSNNQTPLVEFNVTDLDSGIGNLGLHVDGNLVGFMCVECPGNPGCFACQFIPDPLEDGNHTFEFYASDVTGNEVTETRYYFVDSSGPTVTGTHVEPIMVNQVVTAITTDDLTNIAEAVYYLDGNYGEAFQMQATDGTFNNLFELVEAEIEISELETGAHYIEVKARDAAGNWGDLGDPATFYVYIECEGFTFCQDLYPVWDDLWLLPGHELENITSLEGNYTVPNVLASIDENYDMVYYHNGEEWLSYVPERDINDLEYMNNENNFPYWIRMLIADVLEIV